MMRFSLKPIICSAVFAFSSMSAPLHAQTLDELSVLPETMSSPPDQTPNILLVVDISGSMWFNSSGEVVDSHDPSSRSYQVRETLRSLFDNNLNNMNVGLATFGNEGSFQETGGDPYDIKDCGGYDSADCTVGSDVRLYARDLTGKGVIMENIAPLTSAHRDSLNTLLATEPEYPTFESSGQNAHQNRFWAYFPYPDDNLTYNGTLISGGGTPLTGSLETAKSYLLDQNLTAAEVDFDLTDIEYLTGVSGTAAQCIPSTYVFLITDGAPSITSSGGGVSNTLTEVANTVTAAKNLYTGGVETWVFGFSVTDTEKTYMNAIASGGSNGERGAFISTDADSLKRDLESALSEITRIAGSSSGISVIASSSDAAGSVIQAIYNPEIDGEKTTVSTDFFGVETKTTEDVEIAWTSTLSAFFIDEYGYLREDNPISGTQGKLDDYNIDSAFELGFDDTTQEVTVTRLTPTGLETDAFAENRSSTTSSLEDLNPVWEAGELLSSYTQTVDGTNVYSSKNRTYNTAASEDNGYRYIFSWLEDNPGSGNFSAGSIKPFLYSDDSASESFNPTNYTLLADNAEDADKVIRFIRGEEGIEGFRNRSTDERSYLLGDIIHSTAAQVDRPGDNYDTQFNDQTYTAFRDYYEYRRRMVYVGANDGLLHAFNGGFWDGPNTQYQPTATDLGCTSSSFEGFTRACDDVPHELGAEVWAYAPMNLLPHLKFLTNTNYDSSYHISYIDGAVKVFDAKIFDESSTHINGWGTLLVVGMRLGGTPISDVDPDADNTTDNSFTARSAYIVLDVTDPSQPPTVLGEITDASMGYALGEPTIVREFDRSTSNSSDNWYIAFGSGPTDLQTSTSDQQARFYLYNLKTGVLESKVFGEANSFVGDLASHDWNGDNNVDAVYFGTVEGSESATSGAIYRFVDKNHPDLTVAGEVVKLVDTNAPIFYAPALTTRSGQNWVNFGSGRYLTTIDAENSETNYFYGVKEPIEDDGSSSLFNQRTFDEVTLSSLVDVTGVEVRYSDTDETITNGELNAPVSVDGTSIDNFPDFKRELISNTNVGGWRFDIPASTGTPSGKNSATPLSFKDILFQTYYVPPVSDNNQCTNEFGSSYLRAVDLTTGIASFTPEFAGVLGNSGGFLTTDALLGDGYAYRSYLFVGPDPETGKNRIIIKSPLSTGEIEDTPVSIPPGPNGRTSWREIIIQ